MAVIATLHGLPAAAPGDCSLLQLGCGDAANLLALGAALPGIRAVGVDADPAAIARGEARCAAAGITNVTLQAAGFQDAEVGAASADYVVIDHVLSAADASQRDAALALAARALRPGGLLLLSYPALPGAHLRAVVRDVARGGIREPSGDVAAQAAAATERLRLAAEFQGGDTAYGQLMTAEAERYAATDPELLLREELSEPWQPFSVRQVAGFAAAHGLGYVGEVRPFDRWSSRFVPEAAERLRQVAGPGAVERQQFADDVTGTPYHASLFVLGEAPDSDDAPVDQAAGLYVLGGAQISAVEPPDEVRGQVIEAIAAQLPHPLLVRDLARRIELDEPTTAKIVLELAAGGFATLHAERPAVVVAAGERPLASPLVRAQLAAGESRLASLQHTIVAITEPLVQEWIGLLDGTRDRAAIRAELPPAAAARGVSDEDIASLLTRLDDNLDALARIGLLVQ